MITPKHIAALVKNYFYVQTYTLTQKHSDSCALAVQTLIRLHQMHVC